MHIVRISNVHEQSVCLLTGRHRPVRLERRRGSRDVHRQQQQLLRDELGVRDAREQGRDEPDNRVELGARERSRQVPGGRQGRLRASRQRQRAGAPHRQRCDVTVTALSCKHADVYVLVHVHGVIE